MNFGRDCKGRRLLRLLLSVCEGVRKFDIELVARDGVAVTGTGRDDLRDDGYGDGDGLGTVEGARSICFELGVDTVRIDNVAVIVVDVDARVGPDVARRKPVCLTTGAFA